MQTTCINRYKSKILSASLDVCGWKTKNITNVSANVAFGDGRSTEKKLDHVRNVDWIPQLLRADYKRGRETRSSSMLSRSCGVFMPFANCCKWQFVCQKKSAHKRQESQHDSAEDFVKMDERSLQSAIWMKFQFVSLYFRACIRYVS